MVEFKNKQLDATIEDLASRLEQYERKFMWLIDALRDADPVDGVAGPVLPVC